MLTSTATDKVCETATEKFSDQGTSTPVPQPGRYPTYDERPRVPDVLQEAYMTAVKELVREHYGPEFEKIIMNVYCLGCDRVWGGDFAVFITDLEDLQWKLGGWDANGVEAAGTDGGD